MSKRTRSLLISAIALIVLCALLTVVLLIPSPEGTGDSTTTTANTPDTTIAFKPTTSSGATKPTGTTANKTPIHSVTVTTPEETFTVEPNEKGYLRVKGYEDLEDFANTAYYSYLIEELSDITALRLVNSAPEHPADFGFDPEKGCSTAAVDVVYTDASTFSFEIGDEAPSGEGYYFRESSSSAVYLVDIPFVDTVSQPSTGYLSMVPIAAPTTTQTNAGDTAVVRDVLLSGTVRPEPISFQVSQQAPNKDENAQIMTGYYLSKPFYRNLRSGTQLLSVTTYSGLVANRIAKIRPTETDFATYGLDNPYSQCTVNLSIQKTTVNKDENGKETTSLSFYNTFEYTIKLGNTVKDHEECRYAVVYHEDELVPMVYEVVVSSLKWAEVQYDDLADPLLFFNYIDEVDTFSITLDNKTTAFKLTHYPDKEEQDERLKVVANGNRYSTKAFRDLYQQLMGILRVTSTEDKPTGAPVLTLDIKTNAESSQGGQVKLYRYSAGKYLAEHDTGEIYLVGAKDVEDAIKQCRELIG